MRRIVSYNRYTTDRARAHRSAQQSIQSLARSSVFLLLLLRISSEVPLACRFPVSVVSVRLMSSVCTLSPGRSVRLARLT